MKISTFLLKQKTMVIKFVHLQLFITLISIPILICWGMPISLLTFAGNLFFSPILTAFLLFSSLIFFCQILHIPNGILIYCLEHITHWWLWIIQWGNKSYLVALPQPSICIIILIPVVSLAILHHKKINTPYKGIICYGSFLLLVCIYLKLHHTPIAHIDSLACNKGTVTIISHNNQLIVIDPGVIGRRLSALSWCEYTLMPHLVKKYGTTVIDHLIVLQPNKIIFDALCALQEKIIIKNIYLTMWEGKLPFYWWRRYAQLRDICKEKNCRLIYINKKEITHKISAECALYVSPLPNIIQLNEFSYPAIYVHGIIDNQNLAIYSAKYKIGQNKKKDDHGTSQSINGNCI